MNAHQSIEETGYLKVNDIAKLLGVSISTIYVLCNAGSIPHYTFGSTKRFRKEEIQEWIKHQHRGIA